MNLAKSAVTAATLSLLLLPASARAVDAVHENLFMAVDVCQGALPSYEGAFRKRPRGIRNEGTGPAFISCALWGDAFGIKRTSVVQIVLVNGSGGQSRTATCTLVDGPLGSNSAAVFSSPRTVTTTLERMEFNWNTSDNGGLRFNYPAISCNVPPEVEVSFVYQKAHVEVGN